MATGIVISEGVDTLQDVINVVQPNIVLCLCQCKLPAEMVLLNMKRCCNSEINELGTCSIG